MTGSIADVAVVIPTYNRVALLAHAVESVLAQDYPNWEIVVADDGSTDATRDYLSSLSNFPVRHLRLPHTGNVAVARNAGARSAGGSHLAFLDSDDMWHPAKLGVQLREMHHAGVPWSYTGFQLVDDEGNPVPLRGGDWNPLSGRILDSLLTTEASVAVSTLVVEAALFTSLRGFDEDPRLNFREDYEFVLRLALASPTLAVADRLTSIREHGGRSTKGLSGAVPDVTAAHAYSKILPLLPDRASARLARRRRGHHLAEAGSQYLSARAIGPAACALVRSIGDGVGARQWASAVARGLGRRR
jgi:glycosyltransferase involved in cell wall biosynthesis